MPYRRLLRISILCTIVVLGLGFVIFEYAPPALRWRAERAAANGQTKDAVGLLTRAVALNPGDVHAHMRLVDLYNVLLKYDTQPLQSPMFPKLLAHLEAAAQRTEDVKLQERVTRVYDMLGNTDQVRKTALRAAALETTNQNYLRLAVVEAIDQGQLEFAGNLLKKLNNDGRSFATLLVQAQYQQSVYDVVGLKRKLNAALNSASDLSDSAIRSLETQDVTALYRLLRAAVQLDDPSGGTVERANEAFAVVRRIAVSRESTSELVDAYANAIAVVNAAWQANPIAAGRDHDLTNNRLWLLKNCRSLVVTLEAAPVPALCEDVASMDIPATRLQEITTLRTQVRDSIATWGDADEGETTFWNVGLESTPTDEAALNAS